MTFIVADRVQETTNSPGTGTATLLGAVSGYQSFSTGIGANNTTYYVIADQLGTNWEVGLGALNSTGTVLTRTTVYSSSNGGSTVNFATGLQYVWCDFPAGKALTTFSAGTTGLTPNTATSGAITLAGTLATSNGGTGLTSTGTSGNVLTSNGSAWTSAAPSGGSGLLLNIQYFTATATYTATSGTTFVVVQVVGGGGNGGTASGTIPAGGGGAGGYGLIKITSSFSGVTATVGGAGGTSSFGTLVSCTGGSNGSSGSSGGGAGGTSSSADVNSGGGCGCGSSVASAGLGGLGGSSFFGGGGSGGGVGTAATAYGAGGGGGGSSNVGGAGKAGIIIVYEYK